VLLYEFPFNESVRTLLRLEQLFDRLGQLAERDKALDHHFALVTLFEVLEVAQRTDLKGELMKELDRHRAQLNAYRGNPAVSQDALAEVIAQLDQAFKALHAMQGKPGSQLTGNEMLAGLRSRISIPGGTCEFDLPGYHAWQQGPLAQRRQDLLQWMESVMPLARAVALLLRLLRDNGTPHKVAAQSGQYQQTLTASRSHQLLRLRIDPSLGLVPEISGHRLMVSIRLMRSDAEGRLRLAAGEDVPLELSLCA
jgi:cell division protein ZapD